MNRRNFEEKILEMPFSIGIKDDDITKNNLEILELFWVNLGSFELIWVRSVWLRLVWVKLI